MITTSPTILHISAALLKFQGAVDGVKRDSDNPFFSSKYADLEKVVDTARPHLQSVGIAFLQAPGVISEGCLAMTTRLIHAESGEWIEGTGSIPLGKKDPQGAGSAQTYAQRYHLMAILGLPPTDDDGEAAIDRNNSRPAVEPAAPKQLVKTSREAEKQMREEVDACATVSDLEMLWRSKLFQTEYEKLHQTYRDGILELFKERKEYLAANPGRIPPNFDNLGAH